jgi:peptide/nickel transport system permease protein
MPPPRFRSWRRYRQLVAWGVAAALIVLGVGVGPVVAPHDPNQMDVLEALRGPSASHPFGTDEAGRDVLSRVLHGGRESIVAALVVIVASALIGIVVGGSAGWIGHTYDEVVMRATDLFFAFPPIVLAMAVSAALGGSLENAVIASIVVWWPTYARLVRVEVLRVKGSLYVEAGIAVGLSDWRLVTRHVLPHTWGTINARASIDIGYTILFISTLSFVGLGSRPPSAEWGRMVADARNYFLDNWWTMTFPGLALFVTVITFSLLGDAVNDLIGARRRAAE